MTRETQLRTETGAASTKLAGLPLLTALFVAGPSACLDAEIEDDPALRGGFIEDTVALRSKKYNGSCLHALSDASAGNRVIKFGCEEGNPRLNQQWYWEPQPYYTMRLKTALGVSDGAPTCLHALGAGDTGSEVIVHTCNGSLNQRWDALDGLFFDEFDEPQYFDGYMLRSTVNPNNCVQATEEGALRLRPCAALSKQIWEREGKDNCDTEPAKLDRPELLSGGVFLDYQRRCEPQLSDDICFQYAIRDLYTNGGDYGHNTTTLKVGCWVSDFTGELWACNEYGDPEIDTAFGYSCDFYVGNSGSLASDCQRNGSLGEPIVHYRASDEVIWDGTLPSDASSDRSDLPIRYHRDSCD